MLWKYPLPDNVGLLMDRVEGNQIQSVIQGSAAEKSGLQSGDRIGSINGQIITSIADIQWVLHHLENGDQTIAVKTTTGARHRVSVRKGWKKYDISWRGSMWSVSPMLRVWAPTLASDRLKALNIEDPQTAFLVKWINRGSKGGRSAFDSGLRQQDIIVELEGKPIEKLTPQQFNAYIKLNYKVGEKLPLTVLRKGKKKKIEIRLVE
jgi:S1-C subfamily serine protease